MNEIYRARLLDALKDTVHELYYLIDHRVAFRTPLCVRQDDVEEMQFLVEKCGLHAGPWWVIVRDNKLVVTFWLEQEAG